jgi:hypothetical protein
MNMSYEEEEYEEGNREEEEAVDREGKEVEEGDVSTLDDSAMAVVSAVPATQDDGKAGGIVNGALKEGELTPEPAQSSPPPVTVATSTTLLVNNTSPPSEKLH